MHLIYKNEAIGIIKPERGIIQGDSLSPLLFTLCMEPISRVLNHSSNPKVEIAYKEINMSINHLFYMDDLKIFAKTDTMLKELTERFLETLEIIGMAHNKSKSCTNTEYLSEVADIISPLLGYKYLGLIEDGENKFKDININNIINKITERIQKICRTNLNSKNIFNAFNEFSLSILNFFIGIINIPCNTLKEWDQKIRNILRENKIHHKTACKERLYMKRRYMGRGLNSLEFNYDKMIYNLLQKLDIKSNSCLRSKLIKLVYENLMVSLNEHVENLRKKYQIPENIPVNINNLNEAFQRILLSYINKKEMHNRLFNHITSINQINDSSIWLTRGKLNPMTEGNFCNIQDRNVLYYKNKCSHCKNSSASVDHIATRCEKMLYYDYKKRHDEIVKIIIISLLNKHTSKKIKYYKYQKIRSVYEIDNLKILVDIPIKTDIIIKDNRPDIVVINKQKKQIFFVEVGVTCIDNLKQV
ncbi:Retrovirus-related Pol polyprotein from type-2 retrotransposable element R2DM [Dictyocoela muelleri]|nr:Retrovirus-related Pol polyprotein from type-2 retrotransposable element R2DM [Dictyocoela muelleri]